MSGGRQYIYGQQPVAEAQRGEVDVGKVPPDLLPRLALLQSLCDDGQRLRPDFWQVGFAWDSRRECKLLMGRIEDRVHAWLVSSGIHAKPTVFIKIGSVQSMQTIGSARSIHR